MIVSCSKCGKEFEKFHPSRRTCRECLAAYQRDYMRDYRIRNPEMERKREEKRRAADPNRADAERARGREYWAKLRHQAIMAYGGYRCACCGEPEPKFLTLDHVFNDGAAHRKKIKNRGSGIFKWLRDHGYPAGFQVLCMNCNHGKALNNGICPHKSQSQSCYENQVKTGEAQTG